MQQKDPIVLFYSYSHKDERLRNQLETHLALLKRQGVIDEWHDRKIGAGQHIDDEIDHHLAASHIILLLVSADFLHSDYCYGTEMARALTMDKNHTARVIPVIVRACDWKSSPLGHLNALPRDGRPVTSWRNRDEAWTNVAAGIRRAATELSSITRADATPAQGAHPAQQVYPAAQMESGVETHLPTDQWLAMNQPDLVPVGARFGGMTDGRLEPGADQEIVLQNQGTTMPSDVDAVLFPSSTYIVPNTMPQQRADLHGTYWHGRLDVMPAAGGTATIRLQEARAPLNGDLRVLLQHNLFAPEEPPLGAFLRGDSVFRSARLTITFRDRAGRKLASAFDLDGYHTNEWHHVAGPEVVRNNLPNLTQQAAEDLADYHLEVIAKLQRRSVEGRLRQHAELKHGLGEDGALSEAPRGRAPAAIREPAEPLGGRFREVVERLPHGHILVNTLGPGKVTFELFMPPGAMRPRGVLTVPWNRQPDKTQSIPFDAFDADRDSSLVLTYASEAGFPVDDWCVERQIEPGDRVRFQITGIDEEQTGKLLSVEQDENGVITGYVIESDPVGGQAVGNRIMPHILHLKYIERLPQ